MFADEVDEVDYTEDFYSNFESDFERATLRATSRAVCVCVTKQLMALTSSESGSPDQRATAR